MSGEEFNRAALDELLTIFDLQRIEVFVDNLRQLSVELAQSDVSAVDEIESRAHKLASRAGILGCSRLSERSLALEQACREGSDLHELLRSVEAEAAKADGHFAKLLEPSRKSVSG
ncbi:Hpt domain-containing protein [Notoacmeibacter sp. MSK16QG-6]|uniref:Hpt domain-containing protein n=1 Tax=Notoacmeibacter sp. MSK16QG-6 TaxID=2957982 RepID=UPI00209D00B8|nr:Hpt domain-containing protein [Notoacmeibacter sp. MSK16QG-6]MCP1198571.1 Hpt domain-containing protein [Notoacmeibacter sp. MSK16QG-6]